MTMLDSALAYAAKGWPVIPIHNVTQSGACSCPTPDCKSIAKHPRPKNWESYTQPDEQQIRKWWRQWPNANIGFNAHGHYIIDIDPRHGGDIAWQTLVDTMGGVPETFTVATGGDGVHYYFRTPEGYTIGNRAGVVDGVDVRGDGGQALLPPSLHASGKRYRVLIDAPIAEAPQWLTELVAKPPQVERPAAEWTHTTLPSTSAPAAVQSYATNAFNSEMSRLAQSKNGTRNDTLNKVAFNLYQLVKAGALEELEVTAALDTTAVNLGLAASEIKKTLASAWNSAMPRDLSTVGQRQRPTANEPTPDPDEAPTEPLPVRDTWPYAVDVDGIVYKSTNQHGDIKRATVANFSAAITTEYVSEDGTKTFAISGETVHGKPFSIDISAEDFASDQKLKAVLTGAAGANAPIRAGMAKHLAPAIQLLSAEDITRIQRYTRTGWAGDRFLIGGVTDETTQLQLPRKLPYHVELGDNEPAITSLHTLIQAKPIQYSTIALAFILGAPLAHLAGWRNERYGLFISGKSGNLKSSWTQALMSIYGHDFLRDDLLIKWGEGATRNAIMALATHAHDLPLFIDNYKPQTGGGSRDFVNLIHNLVEGGEKDRLNRAAELRETKAVFCWPLSTGEDVPDTDPASLARILVVPFSESSDEEKAKLAEVQAANNLSTIGAVWLDWVQSDQGRTVAKDIAKQLGDRRDAWAKQLRSMRPDMVNVLRVATNLATNELVWLALCECPRLADFAETYGDQHLEGLQQIASLMADYTAESFEAVRYITALRELIASGRAELKPTNSTSTLFGETLLGWHDDEHCYILPQIARAMVDKLLGPHALNNLSDKTLYAQLDALGHIAAKDAGKNTKLKRINGTPQRLLWLPYKLLLGGSDDDETQETV